MALATDKRHRLPPHIDYVDRLLVDVALSVQAGVSRRLAIHMPPRHGKSEEISRYFPAWFLGMWPDYRLILASYEADFAGSWGRKARDLLEEYGRPVFDVAVRQDSSARTRWDIDGHSGGMIAAGVGGPLTGKGAHVLVIDDPVKNAQDAQSEVNQRKQWDWYTSTAYTRLEPGGAVILLMTRWHENDLGGQILAATPEDGVEWEVVNLPALAEPGDLLGRNIGQALWPARFDEDRLAGIRQTLGSQWFNALYQQRPAAAEGEILLRAWWRYYDRRWLDELGNGNQWPGPTFQRLVQSWDTSFKEKTTSDFVVGQLWGEDRANRYLLRQVRGRMGLVECKRQIKDMTRWAVDHFPHLASHPKLVENKANGPEVIAELRDSVSGLLPVNPSIDKVSRAIAAGPQIESGNVFVPGHAKPTRDGPDPARTPAWVQDLVDEAAGFPNATHDDQVDATSQALNWMARRKPPKPGKKTRQRPLTGGLTISDV